MDKVRGKESAQDVIARYARAELGGHHVTLRISKAERMLQAGGGKGEGSSGRGGCELIPCVIT